MRPFLAGLLLALLFAACTTAVSPSTSRTTAPASSPTIPAASPSDQPSPVGIAMPTGLQQATVTRVVDGDTIHVDIGGTDYTVRYIGVDTPETVDPNRPVGCYGPEASAHNKSLVEGKTVWLEKDVSETDKYGRLLRFVWLDGAGSPSGQAEMVDADLVRDGYAQLDTVPPDVKYADTFLQLQREARDAGRGLWGAVCTGSPASATQTPPPPSGNAVCDYSGTSQAVIKGNISSGDEKIYHVPGQQSYDETSINEAAGERWFCTEADAVAAGWRKSKS